MASHTGLETTHSPGYLQGVSVPPETHMIESRVYLGPRMMGATLTLRTPLGWTGPPFLFHHPAPFSRKLSWRAFSTPAHPLLP